MNGGNRITKYSDAEQVGVDLDFAPTEADVIARGGGFAEPLAIDRQR
jgi:hypothetical protein